MGGAHIERVALQVADLEASAALFAELLGTNFRFHRRDAGGEGQMALAFSPAGVELLQSDAIGVKEGLRSFHIRVNDLKTMGTRVEGVGGRVLSRFHVGNMEHMATQVGPFRLVFVSYDGDRGMDALFPFSP